MLLLQCANGNGLKTRIFNNPTSLILENFSPFFYLNFFSCQCCDMPFFKLFFVLLLVCSYSIFTLLLFHFKVAIYHGVFMKPSNYCDANLQNVIIILDLWV